ncbi:patatin-like phospholipase family protein [Kistimonas scapharcae]|uniref:patatin-like phospholipase family protein n=1 Tax=Kistimonas scapharcae TaxID=1036133 RepID=UPI0031E513A0
MKTGIVFSGGGGKGAYAIGVWKALREFGLDQNIQAVSGTSVGALNGALFIQGNLELAEQLWLDIATDKILQFDIENFAQKVAVMAATYAIPGFQGKAILQVAQFFKGRGWFSQDGLKSLIAGSGACRRVAESSVPFYVCALRQNGFQLELPLLNNAPESEVALWLQASSAIPGIFSPVTIQGKNYWDGGVVPGKFSNNTPFQPLIEKEGCTHIINIYLGRSPEVASVQKDYPETRFWNIIPSEQFDGLISALNFTPENARQLIELGYQDTAATLKRFSAYLEDEERYLDAVCEFADGHQEFTDQITLNQQLRSDSGEPVNYQEVMNQLATHLEQQERQLIDGKLDQLIDEMRGNTDELLEEAFSAITALASTEGRINSQQEQGFIGRILGTLTGSNWQQQAEVNSATHASLYATQSLIQKLNHKQMLSMEAMVTLANKTNYLMGHVNMLYGAVQSQEQRNIETFQLFANSIQSLAEDTTQRFLHLEQRLDHIQRKQALDDWYHEIRNLPGRQLLDNLLYATASFYEASGRSWSDPDINRFKSALSDLQLADAEVQPQQIFNREKAQVFAQPLCVEHIFPVVDRGGFHGLLKGLQVSLESDSFPYLCKSAPELSLPADTQVTGLQLGLELLYSLRRNDRRKPAEFVESESRLPSERYLEILAELNLVAESLKMSRAFQQTLTYLTDKIKHFKVIVPVTGKFSAGKSALINRFLGRTLLDSDIEAATSIATEISYGEREYMVLNYLDGHSVEKPLDALRELEVDESLTFIQLFLSVPKLKYRPDLVLVDMPGFDAKNESHQKAIAWYLGRGDFFINLMPSNIAFDDSVIRQLEEIHFDYQKDIAFLISKAGRIPPSNLTELQQELASTLAERGLSDQVPEAIEALDQDGSIQAFEEQLDQAVINKEHLLAARYGQAIEDCIGIALQHIARNIHGLNCDDPELKHQVDAAETAVQRVRQQIERDLSELRYNLCSIGKEELLAEARRTLDSAHGTLTQAARSGQLSQAIQECVRPVVQGRLQQLIQQEVDHLQGKLESFAVAEGDFTMTLSIPAEEKEQFSMTFAGIGAGIAMLFTGPVGALIAGIASGLFGRKDNAEEREQMIRQTINNRVIPETLQRVSSLLDTELNRAVTQLSQHLMQALESERQSNEQQLQALRQELQATVEQRQSVKLQLSEKQARLKDMASGLNATVVN